jgi:glycosyltransferase involved in cell wall biosynthesis
MRVLFVSAMYPKNLRTYVHGVFQRMGMFIEALGEVADLDMLFFVPPDVDVSADAVLAAERSFASHWNAHIRLTLCPQDQAGDAASKWQMYAAPALSLFEHAGYREATGPRQVRAFEAGLARKPDAIFVHRLVAMCPVLLCRRPLPPVYFDLDDIEHVAAVRAIDRTWNWRDKLVNLSRVPSLFLGERRAARLAKKTFVCSDEDRIYLETRCGLRGVVTVPNGVRISPLLPTAPSPTLTFIGSFKYRPNTQAAEFLLHEIWPRVVRAMPDAELIIAGPWPEKIHGFSDADPRVRFIGFVDDLERLYRSSRVVCAPIVSGAGTRIKIIEAAAYGRAIVSTRLGAEGLRLRDGTELLLRDEPDAFAAACVMLLQDPVAGERLGRAAHAAVGEHYSRAAVVRTVQSHITVSGDALPSVETAHDYRV